MSKKNKLVALFAFKMTQELSDKLDNYCKANKISKGKAIRNALAEMLKEQA